MKCLSVQQPWAHLLFTGKDVENRTWTTSYRGPLLIHASGKIDRSAIPEFPDLLSKLNTSAILGVVELVDVVTDSLSTWAADGQYHWQIAKPRLFARPIPYKGRLGLYEVRIDLEKEEVL